MLNKVLFLGPDGYDEFVQKRLPEFSVVMAQNEVDVVKHIETVDVIFDAYMKVQFGKKLLEKSEKLKLFITATTGATHIHTQTLVDKNVPLLTLKGQEHVTSGITAAAEHSWLLLMAIARKLPGAQNEVLNGGWDRNKFPGVMLKGKKIGIIGCGRIGQWMARYAKAFGMTVLGFDVQNNPDPNLFDICDLDVLLSSSDFVSIHIPFSEDNRDFLSSEKISLMKKGVYFINTSRGEVINEAAILEGLKKGNIAGAGLDVLQSEPEITNDPLVEYSRTNNNLIITPHIGGLSPDALDIVLDFSCKRITNFFA